MKYQGVCVGTDSRRRSSGDTLDAYKEAAKAVEQSDTPEQIKGGELLEVEQIASLTTTVGGSTVMVTQTTRCAYPWWVPRGG